MNPRATQDKRRWDKFHRLADYIAPTEKEIVLVGCAKDKPYHIEVISGMMPETHSHIYDFAGMTDIGLLAELLRECDLLVCVNSFVMHLGVCLNVPMVAIVGATEPDVILPPHIPRVYSEYAKDITLESVIREIEKSI